jgi:hypothetical protein
VISTDIAKALLRGRSPFSSADGNYIADDVRDVIGADPRAFLTPGYNATPAADMQALRQIFS